MSNRRRPSRDPLDVPVIPGLSADSLRGLTPQAAAQRWEQAQQRRQQSERRTKAARLAERVGASAPAAAPAVVQKPAKATPGPQQRPDGPAEAKASPRPDQGAQPPASPTVIHLNPRRSTAPLAPDLTASDLIALGRAVERERQADAQREHGVRITSTSPAPAADTRAPGRPTPRTQPPTPARRLRR